MNDWFWNVCRNCSRSRL